jgi:single-strand DNA-binding protein
MIILNVSGNLTADAIERNVNGSIVVAFTIASNERYKTRSGELKENVTFVRCAVWNRPELIKLLHKGRAINATGVLKINRYKDSSDEPQINIDMRVSFLQVFGKGKKNEIVADTHTTEHPEITNEDSYEAVRDLPF